MLRIRQVKDDLFQDWRIAMFEHGRWKKGAEHNVPVVNDEQINEKYKEWFHNVLPTCSEGGKYVYGQFDVSPCCSVHGRLSETEIGQFMDCYWNLAVIDDAKCDIVHALKFKNGEDIGREKVEEVMRTLSPPHCLKGGVYKYNRVGICPECTVHGKFEDLQETFDRYYNAFVLLNACSMQNLPVNEVTSRSE